MLLGMIPHSIYSALSGLLRWFCQRQLVKLDRDRVTFRDTASQTAKAKLCALPVEAFIGRFLQHVLSHHFVKIRYYGFLAPGQRPRMAALRQHLSATPVHLVVT